MTVTSTSRRLSNLEQWIGADTNLPVVGAFEVHGDRFVRFDVASKTGVRILRRTKCIVAAVREMGVRGEVTVYRERPAAARHNVVVEVSTPGGVFYLYGMTNRWGLVSGSFGAHLRLSVGDDRGRVRFGSGWISLGYGAEQFRLDVLSCVTSALAPRVWEATVSRPGCRSEVRRAEPDGVDIVVDLFAHGLGHVVVRIDSYDGSVGQLAQVSRSGDWVTGDGAFGRFLRAEVFNVLGMGGSEAGATMSFVRLLCERTTALVNLSDTEHIAQL